jgi:hypothetical protein
VAITRSSKLPNREPGNHAVKNPTLSTRPANSLTVLGQGLFTGLGQPGSMLLQAGENGLIAIVHDRAAQSRHVPRTGVVTDLLR